MSGQLDERRPKQLQIALKTFRRAVYASGGALYDYEDRLINEIIPGWSGSSHSVKSYYNICGPGAAESVIRSGWHDALRRVLSDGGTKAPKVRVLCAFGQVADWVFTREGLEALVERAEDDDFLAVREAERSARDLASGIGSCREVDDMAEAVAAIVHLWTKAGDKKITIKGSALRDYLANAVSSLSEQHVRPVLGGAAAIIADVLAQLGLTRVDLHTMYHSDKMAELYLGGPRRLKLERGASRGKARRMGHGKGPGFWDSGDALDPMRSSYIFPHEDGEAVRLGDRDFTATKDDRIILRAFRYTKNHADRWSHAYGSFLEQGHRTGWVPLNERGWGDDEWPFLTAFASWHIQQGSLCIECLGRTEMEKELPEYGYVVLNAPGLGSFAAPSRVRDLEVQTLRQQLAWLRRRTARIHLEISGADREQLVSPFICNMRGLLHSLGLGADELEELGLIRDWQPRLLLSESACQVYRRWEIALRLASDLELDRLYVHGADIDIILRRDGSDADMRKEIRADLYAKAVVLLAVLQRSVGDPAAYMKADGTIAKARSLLQAAENLLGADRALRDSVAAARHYLQEAQAALVAAASAEATAQAENAIEVLRKNGVADSGAGSAPAVSPLLPASSFEALFDFVFEFVRFHLGEADPGRESGLTERGEEAYVSLMENGIWTTPQLGGYSLGVVPVLWRQLPIRLNPTGAGDICSGVSAVYSGF